MRFTRRQFVRGGVTAFTFGFAAPQFLTELALAQSGGGRNLVVLYLSGGNDALSTLVPYGDADYYARRPTIGVPASAVLQVGTDREGNVLGLHPALTGLKSIFNDGRLAIIQRSGYENSSRSHFQGFDIYGTANPTNSQGTGWLGRYQFPAASAPALFPPNSLGFFDFAGNVSEWVNDRYLSYVPSGAVTDPLGPNDGKSHAYRGSNWRTVATGELRFTWREGAAEPSDVIGFRVARYVAAE